VTTREESTGYLHPDYAASFSEFGVPRSLPRSGGRLLERPIPGTAHRDAMGCYPLLCCRDWSQLGADLDELEGSLVSVVAVTDPFAPVGPKELTVAFERAVPFKEHLVADLTTPLDELVSASHRATVRRARRRVEVRVHPRPWELLDIWVELFATLRARHGIDGIRAFSPAAFALQLRVPGMVAFEARHDGEVVGLDLWFEQGDVAYGHLVAMSDVGYATRASYATKWAVLEHFAAGGRVRWVDLGGGAGADAAGDDGLTRFKRGWSDTTRTAWLCSRVLDRRTYDELASSRSVTATSWFPAYRADEAPSD
jgi:hypothetical protein